MAVNTIKYILTGLNVLLVICGITLIIFGSLTVSSQSYMCYVQFGTRFGWASISAGSTMVILAALGWYAVWKESFLMLVVYAMALITICIVDIIIMIITSISSRDFEEQLRQNMERSLINYKTNQDDKSFWDILQRSGPCCGIDSYIDWGAKGMPLPESCCIEDKGTHRGTEDKLCEMYKKRLTRNGCHKHLVNVKNKFRLILFSVGAVLVLLKVSVMVHACWFAVQIKHGREEEFEEIETARQIKDEGEE